MKKAIDKVRLRTKPIGFCLAVLLALSKPVIAQVYSGSGNDHIEQDGWFAEYKHDLILIPSDGLIIPVQLEKPTVTLINEAHGRFMFSENEVRAVTRTPVTQFEFRNNEAKQYRPTLFVTLCGFLPETRDGHCSPYESEDWPLHIEDKIDSVHTDYQYKHFYVQRDTYSTNKLQVRDLAEVIGDFLQARTYEWDVVLVGHSRGGIFAHDLAKRLVNQSKVNNLFTYLLDPTASSIHGDVYPVVKPEQSNLDHYGMLYYDGEPFIDGDYGIEFGTISDRDINGYFSHFYQAAHTTYATQWVANSDIGFDQALRDIQSTKALGSFNEDGESGIEIITLSGPDDFSFNGDIAIENGNVTIQGELTVLNGLPGNTLSIDSSVGVDGVELASVNAVSTTHVIINQDIVYVSNSTPVGSHTASVNSNGVSADVTTRFINTGINIDDNGIELYIGSTTITDDTAQQLLEWASDAAESDANRVKTYTNRIYDFLKDYELNKFNLLLSARDSVLSSENSWLTKYSEYAAKRDQVNSYLCRKETVPAPTPWNPGRKKTIYIPAGCNHILDALESAERRLLGEADSRNDNFRQALLGFEGRVISSINR